MDHEAMTRRSGRQRTCLWIGLAVVVCCCGLPSLLGWWALQRAVGVRGNVGWIDAERKKLPPLQPLPAPAVNAADTYAAAVAALPSESEPNSISEWYSAVGRKDTATADQLLPEVRDWVSHSSPALAKVHEAAAQEYVSPAEPDPNQLKPWLARYRRLARTASVSAYLAHRGGNDEPALAAVRDAYALGVKTPRGGGLMEQLVGVACVSLAQRPSTEIMLSGAVSPGALRAHAAGVRRIRGEVWPMSRVMGFEGACTMHALDQLARGEMPVEDFAYAGGEAPNFAKQVRGALISGTAGRSREWIEDRYARYVEELDKPLGESRFRELAERSDADIKARNDIIAGILMPTLNKVPDKWNQMVASLAADETIACLEACKKEKGSYPATLAGLVPDYMPEVPQDPWTGRPLIYRLTPERYTLYAVGSNGVDDGGVTEGRGLLEPDLVIVPIPPVKQP